MCRDVHWVINIAALKINAVKVLFYCLWLKVFIELVYKYILGFHGLINTSLFMFSNCDY